MLAVCVDDFKLAGVEKDIAPAWEAISDAVNAEPSLRSEDIWFATTSLEQ